MTDTTTAQIPFRDHLVLDDGDPYLIPLGSAADVHILLKAAA
jgi:hypothetical protein